MPAHPGGANLARRQMVKVKTCSRLHARRPAWINDLQGGGLESGVNRASPGRHSVDPALARLAEEVGIAFGQARPIFCVLFMPCVAGQDF